MSVQKLMYRVWEHLKNHDRQTAREICTALDIPMASASSVLSKGSHLGFLVETKRKGNDTCRMYAEYSLAPENKEHYRWEHYLQLEYMTKPRALKLGNKMVEVPIAPKADTQPVRLPEISLDLNSAEGSPYLVKTKLTHSLSATALSATAFSAELFCQHLNLPQAREVYAYLQSFLKG